MDFLLDDGETRVRELVNISCKQPLDRLSDYTSAVGTGARERERERERLYINIPLSSRNAVLPS